jgi:hypothetical protein
MKRLEIKNFTKAIENIYSDYFLIQYSREDSDKYVMAIEVRDVISFKPLDNKYYIMAIYKERRTDSENGYGIKLWDIGRNITYPMSIWKDNLKSISDFTSFLNHTLKLANNGDFSGNNGNEIK